MNVVLIAFLLFTIFVLFLRQRIIKRDLEIALNKINYLQNDLDCLNSYLSDNLSTIEKSKGR